MILAEKSPDSLYFEQWWSFLFVKDNEGRRLIFGDFVDKAFWLLICGFLGWIALSVTSLNEKMAVVITQISYEQQLNHEQDVRIREIEKSIKDHSK